MMAVLASLVLALTCLEKAYWAWRSASVTSVIHGLRCTVRGAVTVLSSAVEENVYQVRNQSNQDPLNFPIKVNNRLANLMTMAERGDGRPTNNMAEIFGILSTELKGYTDRLSQIWTRDLEAVNSQLRRLGLPPLDPKCAKVEGCGVS